MDCTGIFFLKNYTISPTLQSNPNPPSVLEVIIHQIKYIQRIPFSQKLFNSINFRHKFPVLRWGFLTPFTPLLHWQNLRLKVDRFSKLLRKPSSPSSLRKHLDNFCSITVLPYQFVNMHMDSGALWRNWLFAFPPGQWELCIKNYPGIFCSQSEIIWFSLKSQTNCTLTIRKYKTGWFPLLC